MGTFNQNCFFHKLEHKFVRLLHSSQSCGSSFVLLLCFSFFLSLKNATQANKELLCLRLNSKGISQTSTARFSQAFAFPKTEHVVTLKEERKSYSWLILLKEKKFRGSSAEDHAFCVCAHERWKTIQSI